MQNNIWICLIIAIRKGDFILYYTDGDIKENKDFVIKEIPISPDSIEDLKRELRLIWIIIAMESEKLQILCRDKKKLRYVKVE